MRRAIRIVAGAGLAALWVAAAPAAGDEDLCRLLVEQARIELDDQTLAVRGAEIERKAASDIFVLVDELWKGGNIERLLFLGARHGRDRTRLEVDRARSLLERRRATVRHYETLCGERDAGDAVQAFREADCEVRRHDVAIAEIELAYRKEVLDSVLALRRNHVATRQEVIAAERDVTLVEAELESAARRREACQARRGPRARP